MCAFVCTCVCLCVVGGRICLCGIHEARKFLRGSTWIWSVSDLLCYCREISPGSRTPEQNIDQSCWQINNVPCWPCPRQGGVTYHVGCSLHEDRWKQGSSITIAHAHVCGRQGFVLGDRLPQFWPCSLLSGCSWAGCFPLPTSVSHHMELSWELSDSVLGKHAL